MTLSKKVTFLERVDKSKLGLDGLQKVVYSDRARQGNENIENEEYNFAQLGKKMIKEIDGKYIKQKYKNIIQGKYFGQKLHDERVKWMKGEYK